MKPIVVSCSRSTLALRQTSTTPDHTGRRKEMTKIARMTPIIPRGTVIGKRTGGPPLSEAEHFHKCEACGGWFDMRDLGAVLDHEEPLPHPACDQAQ
jgi:hypothetical protein